MSHQHLSQTAVWYSEMFLLVKVLELFWFSNHFGSGSITSWSMSFLYIKFQFYAQETLTFWHFTHLLTYLLFPMKRYRFGNQNKTLNEETASHRVVFRTLQTTLTTLLRKYYRLQAINYFWKKALSQMFDMAVRCF